MNPSLSAYTNLESLLLFQSLNAYGLANNAFSDISKLLKSNPCITSDRRFESGRLSPDALRNFCLKLLKEEEHSEQRQDAQPEQDGQNGQARNSRKRKAPSPTYPTVQEARQQAHLIPKLVSKLYARYRRTIINEIRDDEDRHERLQRELQSLERGERDVDLGERANGRSSVTRSPSLPRRSPLLHQKAKPPSPSPLSSAREQTSSAPPLANAQAVDGPRPPPIEPPQAPAPANGQPIPDGVPRDVPFGAPSKVLPSSTQGPHPPQGPSAVAQPVHVQDQVPPPSTSRRPSPPHPVSTGNNVPHPLPPQFPQPSAYHAPSPVPQVQPPQGIPPLASPHPLRRTQSPSHPSPLPGPLASPVAPPQGPQGARVHPQPPRPYGGNGTPHGGPIPGPPPSFAPPNAHFPAQFPPVSRSPHMHTPQAQRNLPYSGPPSYPAPQQPQQAPTFPPTQGGIMLPPFQVSPQDPTHAQQATPHPPASTPLSRQPHPSTKTGSPASVTARQNLPPLQPLSFFPRNSFSTPLGLRTPQSGLATPRSAKTLWKPVVRNTPAPLVPRPEVSPIDDIEPEEAPKESPVKAKTTRKGRSKKDKDLDQESEAPAETEPDEHVPEMETRRGRSRRMGASRRARPESLASSRAGGSVRERSRSHSIISHTETIGGETESQADTRVKSERGNSFDVIEEDVATPSQPTTRRRGGTAQAHTRGRKRTAREASLADSEDRPPRSSPAGQRVVIAPRHFSRMCNPIMNDISSHKHASTFTTAVKAKNAEGYYDIIKRPTDLKSIQKAIGAGAKIVAAAATASDTPVGGASPGGGGGVVELPLSEDVIPPKAIVNSAQLENELMRMFVNAVMFNPGEDGVVEDAREMFETCQQSVSNWRSAERSSGKLDLGAGAGAGVLAEEIAALAAGSDDIVEGGAAGKRRKVG